MIIRGTASVYAMHERHGLIVSAAPASLHAGPPHRGKGDPRSVQAWRFEEAVAVGGGDAQLEHAAGAVDCEGNLDTCVA